MHFDVCDCQQVALVNFINRVYDDDDDDDDDDDLPRAEKKR